MVVVVEEQERWLVGKGDEGYGEGIAGLLCEEIEMRGCTRGYAACYGSVHAEEDDDVVEVGFYFRAECGGLGLGF